MTRRSSSRRQYTTQREQFGKPIATFQAVGQRAADAYIDAEAVRLTAWQAVWRLAEGLPATSEVAVAKYWADEGAQRVVHAAQHLHGGMGVDRDYPLHRYYLLGQAPGAHPRGRHHQPAAAGRGARQRTGLTRWPRRLSHPMSCTLAPSSSRTKSAPSACDGV